jgi:hypothetical protein
VFRVSATQYSLARVRRWQAEGTIVRAYLGHDRATMLADPALGGKAACEPSFTCGKDARQQAAPDDQPATEDKQVPPPVLCAPRTIPPGSQRTGPARLGGNGPRAGCR